MKREKNIDLFKAILVLGMILAHVIRELIPGNKVLNSIRDYIELISFSGFLFCFGYSSYLAYLSKDFKQVKKKIIKNICRLAIVFYVSGISYELLIAKNYDIYS